MALSKKQKTVIREANARWNVLCGAVRSGKTYASFDLIPKRLVELPDGDRVMIGRTRQTLERNVLNPLRRRLGDAVVSPVDSKGMVQIAGKPFYCMGAGNKDAVTKLQGMGLVYAYGDEMSTWHPEVFEMLKSRLSDEGAVFDGTTNPAHPGHWLKRRLLDKEGLDVRQFHFVLEDNPFLPKSFVENLKREYAGTVYYDRYILGKWTAAEGTIYRQFADNPDAYCPPGGAFDAGRAQFISVGVDFGGTRSLTTFVASAILGRFEGVAAIADGHIRGRKGDIDAARLCEEFVAFIGRLRTQWPGVHIKYVFADSEAQYLINSLRRAVAENGLGVAVCDCAKRPIRERIVAANTLLNTGRMFVAKECALLRDGLSQAVWDPAKPDGRLDDFTSDIDILDAFEYSWERFIPRLLPRMR